MAWVSKTVANSDDGHRHCVCGNSGSRRRDGDEVAGGCILRSALQLDRLLCRRPYGHRLGQIELEAGPGISGSTDLFQTIDTFDEGGKLLCSACKAATITCCQTVFSSAPKSMHRFRPFKPSLVQSVRLSIGGISNFTSPTLGAVSYSETVLSSGTVRGRIGYAPGHWLFYATGGFAWTYNQQSLTQLATGNSVSPFLWRLGWAAGAGVEVPIVPHWTARLEYLFTDYGTTTRRSSEPSHSIPTSQLQELRLGVELSVRQRRRSVAAPIVTKEAAAPGQTSSACTDKYLRVPRLSRVPIAL